MGLSEKLSEKMLWALDVSEGPQVTQMQVTDEYLLMWTWAQEGSVGAAADIITGSVQAAGVTEIAREKE